MAALDLKIDDLLLDLVNPRTRKVQTQREALESVIKDQRDRLVALAFDIARNGLNPADRLLVMKQTNPKGYVTLEGNRRVSALQILKDPSVLTGLDMPDARVKKLKAAAAEFDRKRVEPIPAYSFAKREEARRWIEMRHTGQGNGEGIVGWSGVATARFRGNSPSLQAIDLVKRFGELSHAERERLDDDISISVIDRVMGSSTLKSALGIETKSDVLYTKIVPSEVIKPLTHIVKEVLSGNLTNRTINRKEDQEKYVKSLPKEVKPDLSKSVESVPVDGLAQSDFSKSDGKKRRTRGPSTQKGIFPRGYKLNIPISRINDIFQEVSKLEIEKNKNAIAVLMRILLEMTADEYLDENDISRKKGREPHLKDKTLSEKVSDCCAHLVEKGTKAHKLKPVTTSINNRNSPLYHDLLNQYVHNAYHSPSPGELRSGGNILKTFLDNVWN